MGLAERDQPGPGRVPHDRRILAGNATCQQLAARLGRNA